MEQRTLEDVEPGDEVEVPWQATPDAAQLYMTTRRGAVGGVSPAEAESEAQTDSAPRPGFDRPIIAGPMSLGVITRVVTDWMGPHGRLRSIDVDYRRPVYRDDLVRVVLLVTDTEAADGRGVVKLDAYFVNERGERPVQGVAVVELPLRA